MIQLNSYIFKLKIQFDHKAIKTSSSKTIRKRLYLECLKQNIILHYFKYFIALLCVSVNSKVKLKAFIYLLARKS